MEELLTYRICFWSNEMFWNQMVMTVIEYFHRDRCLWSVRPK